MARDQRTRSSSSRPPRDIPAEKRVLEVFEAGGEWQEAAQHNGIKKMTAWRLVQRGTVQQKPRGGARASRTKVTSEIKAALERYLDEDCTITLREMVNMVMMDFNVSISQSTVSRYLCGALYTMKKVRNEPVTCSNEINKTKRQEFAKQLLQHIADGDFIVYYDETNFNLCCARTQGRSKNGDRSLVKKPPSKGPNLQVQCAVSTAAGLIHFRRQRGSIKMDQNATFVQEIYDHVKDSSEYQDNFAGKKIVIVFDNAPVHNQTEARVDGGDDLMLLRLAPYLLMSNPIEGCFSVFKAQIKTNLRIHHDEMFEILPHLYRTLTEQRMDLLEEAADFAKLYMKKDLVNAMAIHCMHALNAAARFEDMMYGK